MRRKLQKIAPKPRVDEELIPSSAMHPREQYFPSTDVVEEDSEEQVEDLQEAARRGLLKSHLAVFNFAEAQHTRLEALVQAMGDLEESIFTDEMFMEMNTAQKIALWKMVDESMHRSVDSLQRINKQALDIATVKRILESIDTTGGRKAKGLAGHENAGSIKRALKNRLGDILEARKNEDGEYQVQ